MADRVIAVAFIPLLTATALSGCVALTVSTSYPIDVLTAEEEARLAACGLSDRSIDLLGEDAGVLLSLIDSGVVTGPSVGSLAEVLTYRGSPTPMREWPCLALGPAGQSAALPPEPPRVVSAPLGPFPYPDRSDPYMRGVCWKLVTAPARWQISALVTLPILEEPEGAPTSPIGAYMYFGLEAPGVAAIGGLARNPVSGSWDVFLWGGQASGDGGWRQASLAGPPRDAPPSWPSSVSARAATSSR